MNMLLYDQDPKAAQKPWRLYKLDSYQYPSNDGVSNKEVLVSFHRHGQPVAITDKIKEFRDVVIANKAKQMLQISNWNHAIYKLISGTSTTPAQDLGIQTATRKATHDAGASDLRKDDTSTKVAAPKQNSIKGHN